MSSVDDRIVNMQFNNKQFTQGVTQSQKSLDGLEKTLANTAKGKGLTTMASSVDGVSHKFSAMRVAGIAAVATIASKATAVGLNLIKSFTLDPIRQGFQEYQTNLNSIQTVMANTGKSVSVVNKYLGQLNHYSDQTIYNFSQMAHNVGTFTAAGVGLKTSVASIQGISNIAALSGSSAEQASTAMYQLSQAIAAGRVGLQDWNSVVNAGMGGKNLQRALIQTGTAMGTIDAKTVSMGKNIKIAGASFRESISAKGGKSWLTSDVLVKTLALMDGRISKAALHMKGLSDPEIAKEMAKQEAIMRKQGYTPEQIKSLENMADQAFQSATVIKTLPQLLGVVKESLGSVWSTAFQGIMGNFQESKKIWSAAGRSIQTQINQFNRGLQNMLGSWRALGGRDAVIQGFQNAFSALGKVLGVVKDAFRDVFPPGAGAGIASLSKGFERFTAALIPGAKTLESLRSIFGGVFAVLHIGFTIVSGLAQAFGAFFGAIFSGSGEARGGILSFFASIGEALKSFDKMLTSGGKLTTVMRNVGASAGAAVKPFIQLAGVGIKALGGLADKIKSLFTGNAGGGASMGASIVQGIISGLTGALGAIKAAAINLAHSIPEAIKGALGIASPAAELVPVGTAIVQGIIQGIVSAITMIPAAAQQIGGAISSTFKQMFGGMDSLDFASLVNAIFTAGLLRAMTKGAKTVVDLKKMLLEIKGSVVDTFKAVQTQLKAQALRAIAVAIGILAISLLILSKIPLKPLAQGLGAMAIMMGILVKSLQALAAMEKVEGAQSIIELAGAIFLISAALVMMATAVTILGHQDLPTLAKGLGAVAIAMGIMVLAVKAMSGVSGAMASAGAGIFLMAAAMNILAGAVILFGKMDINTLKQGLIGMGIGLAIMVAGLAALGAIGPAVLAGGAALVLAAQAMIILVAALAAFVPVMLLFSTISWGTIVSGVAKIAVVLIAIGAAAIIASPGLLLLGAAMVLAGAGMLAFGLGMAAFGAGFAVFVAAGTAGVAVITIAIKAFLALLPSIAVQAAAAFVAFVEVIAKAAPRLRVAFGTIIKNMILTVQDAVPRLAKLLTVMINAGVGVLRNAVPKFIELGFTIIDSFLRSLNKHIGSITTSAVQIVTKFMGALGNQAGRLANAAVVMIVKFINAVSGAINKHAGDMGKAGLKLGMALINGMTGGLLGKGMELVRNAVSRLANAIPGPIKKILGIASPSKVAHQWGIWIGQGLAGGITASIKDAVGATVVMARAVIAAGNSEVGNLEDAARLAQARASRSLGIADSSAYAASKMPHATKAQKARQKAAQKVAAAQKKAADAAQAKADAAAQRVQDAKDFAAADTHGKGDIMSQAAQGAADTATKLLARAGAEADVARKLARTNRRAAADLLAKSKADAAAAAKYAKAAQNDQTKALGYYAQEVNDRIAAMEATAKADEDAKKAQAEYDAADNQGKIDILNKRAEADAAKAATAQATAASLIEQAKALASKDAVKAMALLDQADTAAQTAKDAADQAQEERDQAAQLLGGSDTSGGSTSGGSSSVTPSRDVLEDAASIIDRYTQSLAEATIAAEAQQPVVQFVQTNNSPVALSVSEVYRQSRNLLSLAEVKMGANQD